MKSLMRHRLMKILKNIDCLLSIHDLLEDVALSFCDVTCFYDNNNLVDYSISHFQQALILITKFICSSEICRMPSQAGRINFILEWKRSSIQVTVEILSPNALLQVLYSMHNNVHFFNSGCRSKGTTSSYSQWRQDWMHFKNPFRRIVAFMRTTMNSTSLDPREEREFDLQLFVAYLTLIMIFVAVIVRSVLCT